MALPRKLGLMPCLAACLVVAALGAGRPAAAADAAAPAVGLAAQERARSLAAELVRGVLDAQLRQLEENGLADRPIHADILALRGAIDSLVQREMREVIELLARAESAAPADRREILGAARTRARAIVTRLAAERQQVVRRLREATLAAEVRAVLERQSRLLKATESVPALPDGRREQVMLGAIEEERNVNTLVVNLRAALEDVSRWGGEIGATGLAGLREFERERVSAAVAAAEAGLAAADAAAAAAEQRRAIAGLEAVLKAVESNRTVQLGDTAAAGKELTSIAGKAAAMRSEMAKVPLTDAAVEKLLDEQSALQETLATLAEQVRGEPAAARIVKQAKDAAVDAAAALLEGDQKRAVASQDAVVGSLDELAALLDAERPRAASAEEFARRANELRKVLQSVEGFAREQQQIGRVATTQPGAAVEAEKRLAGAVAKLLERKRDAPRPGVGSPDAAEAGASALPAAVEQRLRMAAEAAAQVAEAREDGAAQSAVQAATDAIQAAARELADAVADAQRAALAAKAGELSRAAEVAERVASVERGIAEMAKATGSQPRRADGQSDATTSAPAGMSAEALSAKQAEMAAVADTVEDAVDGLSPEAAKMIEEARAAMEAVRRELAAGDAGRQSAGQQAAAQQAAAQQAAAQQAAAQQAAQAAAKAATEAAESLAQAAAAMREDAKQAAEALASLAAEQAAAAGQAREAAEQLAAAAQPTSPADAAPSTPSTPSSPSSPLQRQAESLAARETALARDQLLAEQIAAALAEQSAARAAVTAAGSQMEQQPAGGVAGTPAAQASAALDLAKEQFADAQRAVGERVAAALDQQEIGNEALRESLEAASQQGTLGTGFVPESPEATADMLAAAPAASSPSSPAASSASASAPASSASPASPSTPSSPASPAASAQSASAAASSPSSSSQQASGMPSSSPPSQGQGNAQQVAEQSGSGGSADDEGKEVPFREIVGVDKQADAGSRGGDADVAERSFERDAWFTKLPPEVRNAIRAGSQRRAPRGYEEKMDRYFKNLE